MKYIYLLSAFIIYHSSTNITHAQTAKVYRGGALLSTHSTLAAASAAANVIGDSILLSEHTFKEHNVPIVGGQIWQGTYTLTDSTTIDAEKKGRVMDASIIRKYRAATIRNIICQNGETIFPQLDGGGINSLGDSIVLKGYTIIRNCHASRNGGGVSEVFLQDFTKIYRNVADSSGGGASIALLYGSAEVFYNRALFGGGLNQANFQSTNVKIHDNIASIGGGGVYGMVYSNGSGFQIVNNQAPKGAAIYGRPLPTPVYAIDVRNAYIYNPAPDGSRQNEIYIDGGNAFFEGCWFGQSDTTGLITHNPMYSFLRDGKHAIASWSINRGVSLTAADTLFPIGAAFVYSDGTAIPSNACPWLVGKFSASDGVMLTPNPTVSALDTMSSLYRTYVYPSGGSGSKPIDFLCIVDHDTFRATKLVWGRSLLSIAAAKPAEEQQVLAYPNPAQDYLYINGAAAGSEVALFDLSGKEIQREKTKSSITTIQVKGLPSGQYLLKITSPTGAEGSAKILKE